MYRTPLLVLAISGLFLANAPRALHAGEPCWLTRCFPCCLCRHDNCHRQDRCRDDCDDDEGCFLTRKWRRMEPPPAATVYSVPAVMVPQQALAIEPQQFRSMALACSRSDGTAEQTTALSKELKALAERLSAEAPQGSAEAFSADERSVEQRLKLLEHKIETLTRLLEQHAESK